MKNDPKNPPDQKLSPQEYELNRRRQIMMNVTSQNEGKYSKKNLNIN